MYPKITGHCCDTDGLGRPGFHNFGPIILRSVEDLNPIPLGLGQVRSSTSLHMALIVRVRSKVAGTATQDSAKNRCLWKWSDPSGPDESPKGGKAPPSQVFIAKWGQHLGQHPT